MGWGHEDRDYFFGSMLDRGRLGRLFQNASAPANGKVYVATPTALKINPVNASAKTFVVVNDDPENPVLYGDSACGPSTGQKIQPGEKVTFVGIPSPFNLYVCTATGSATVRVVEQ